MIKDRVIQILENKGIAKENFYKKIGVTSANFRGKAKLTPLNSNTIENILSEMPEINLQWLLTGQGEMFKKNNDVTKQSIKGNSNQMSGSDMTILGNSRELSELKKQISQLQKQLSDKEDQVNKLIEIISKLK